MWTDADPPPVSAAATCVCVCVECGAVFHRGVGCVVVCISGYVC